MTSSSIVEVAGDPVFEQLRTLVLGLCKDGEPEVRPDTRFDDLGLDSVDRLELLVAIEDACGVALPDEQLATPTVGCVAEAIRASLSPDEGMSDG
ncbi:MAG: acyl carrier protein [Solirubrobacterales bacterium]